jgi:hypothetical protein
MEWNVGEIDVWAEMWAMNHRARHSMTMYLRAGQLRVTYIRARHDMVQHVGSWLVMVMHVRIRHVMVMHVMVWNVSEMHVWAEISGQGTQGKCI